MPGQPQPQVERVVVTEEQRRALDEVFCRLYDKIRRLAARVRWNSSNPTLNPTALVHEAYLKLLKHPPDLASKSYEEVIGVFSNAMHQILIDAGRRKSSRKRAFADPPDSAGLPIEEVIAIGTALQELDRDAPRQAQIVRCRFLLGLTVEETSAAMGLSKRAIERDWRCAKAWLARKILPTGD